MNKLCEQAPLYFYGELNQQQSTAFKAHLAACTACQRELAFLAQTQAALVSPAAPQALVERVLQAEKQPLWTRVLKPVFAAAGVLLLAVYIVPKWTGHTGQTQAENWVAYVSQEADAEYQNFLTDFEAFEDEF